MRYRALVAPLLTQDAVAINLFGDTADVEPIPAARCLHAHVLENGCVEWVQYGPWDNRPPTLLLAGLDRPVLPILRDALVRFLDGAHVSVPLVALDGW